MKCTVYKDSLLTQQVPAKQWEGSPRSGKSDRHQKMMERIITLIIAARPITSVPSVWVL